jgi:hypothetical protein
VSRIEARTRRFVRWVRQEWEDASPSPAAVSAPFGEVTSETFSAKRREDEQIQAQVRAEEHRENVWLAVGSLLVLAGVAVMTAAWLHTAPATKAEPHPATLFDHCETRAVFFGGLAFVIAGAIVLLGFFWEPLGSRLPLTVTEKHRLDAIRSDESQTRPSAEPKPPEAGHAPQSSARAGPTEGKQA